MLSSSTDNATRRQRGHALLRGLWIAVFAMVALLLAIESYRLDSRRRALDELVQLIELPKRGQVSVSTSGFWTVFQATGLDEQWYFTDCFVGLKQTRGEDGAFLTLLSTRAIDIVTELEAIDNFYDDSNLLQINRMKSLRVLNMNLSYKPDRVFASLDPNRLPLLRAVYCCSNGDGVTDRGITQSKIIPQLEVLELDHCKGVTDESIPTLAQGRKLVHLSIRRTGISKSGFGTLQSSLGSRVSLVW